MKKQSGFTLVEGLLIVLIIAVVSFAGYYVWQKQNSSDDAELNSAFTAQETPGNEEIAETENTIDTPVVVFQKTVESGQKGFVVDIPDGWKVINVMDSDWITVRSADNTVYEEGTPAEVTELESFGTDGPGRLTIIRFNDKNFSFLDGDEENLGEFRAKNATGIKYYKQYPEEVGEGIGPLPGQISYTYMFEVGDSTTFVTYNQQKGESDILSIVEDMISTLQIN